MHDISNRQRHRQLRPHLLHVMDTRKDPDWLLQPPTTMTEPQATGVVKEIVLWRLHASSLEVRQESQALPVNGLEAIA
jgi:hypothetical protein